MLRVEIKVEGLINSEWSEWFKGLVISHSQDNESVISGELKDQSALYGLVAKLRDLGMTLVSIKTSNPKSSLDKDPGKNR